MNRNAKISRTLMTAFASLLMSTIAIGAAVAPAQAGASIHA